MNPDVSTFLTLDVLKTPLGQVTAVVLITQVVRASARSVSTYMLRLVAVATGIAIHAGLVWQASAGPSAYVLAIANGALVAVTAMKTAELIKGDRTNGGGASR